MTAQTPYLVELAQRLASGVAGLDDARRDRHRAFLLSFEQSDGGFTGREGDSDLYYTSFAVRGLMMLGGIDFPQCERLNGYLCRFDFLSLPVIDLMNWLSIALAIQASGGVDPLAGAPDDWTDRVAETIEAVRTADGGYAKSAEGAAGSSYQTFLVSLTYELIGRSVPEPNRLVQFLYDRQRDDGGFVEIAPMKRSGTNPTAAAVVLLRRFGYLDDELCSDIGGFLKEVRSDEGGFQANTRVPFADGLSTFTGLLTLGEIGLSEEAWPVSRERVREWLTGQLEFPTGGFRAATWDEAADVEYTFYGLGLLALLGE